MQSRLIGRVLYVLNSSQFQNNSMQKKQETKKNIKNLQQTITKKKETKGEKTETEVRNKKTTT